MSTKVVNNFNTVLASPISSSATSLIMAAGAGDALRTKITGSPSVDITPGDHLYLTLSNTLGDIEIIKLTSLGTSGDTALVIARNQDGTTGPVGGWAASTTRISARPVAAIFDEAVLATTAAAVSYAGGPGMSATNVEDALDELATEKQNAAASLAALAGISIDAAALLLLTAKEFSGSPKFSARYDERRNALGDLTGAQTISNASGTYVTATIIGAVDFQTGGGFTNPAGSGYASGFLLELTNGGAFAITWPATVKWPGGTAPTLTASGVDILIFTTCDGGTTWRGSLTQKDTK